MVLGDGGSLKVFIMIAMKLIIEELASVVFFFFFRAAPTPHGISQARGQIRAIAASLHHSHSKVGFEQRLRLIPQLTATPDPLTH